MAINFVTGLPRAGKTLFALSFVKDLAKKDNRPVYTCNIPDVTIPGWLEIDHPDKWLTLPLRSILIIDELQDFWPHAPAGRVPFPILELSKHGKKGIDFFIITQEPSLVHATPRGLCAVHYFVVRAFGSHNAMVHKFQRMQLHPEKQKKHSEKIAWSYPKEAFGRIDKETGVVIVKPWYKSAEVHTVKREIPKKIFAIPVLLLLVFGLGFFVVNLGKSVVDKTASSADKSAPSFATRTATPSTYVDPSGRERVNVSPAQYIASYESRVPGLQYTAQRYDALTQPQQVPYPAACVKSAKKCSCFTQQATPLDVPKELCLQIVANGFFMDWVPPSSQPQKELASSASDRQLPVETAPHPMTPPPKLVPKIPPSPSAPPPKVFIAQSK